MSRTSRTRDYDAHSGRDLEDQLGGWLVNHEKPSEAELLLRRVIPARLQNFSRCGGGQIFAGVRPAAAANNGGQQRRCQAAVWSSASSVAL
jgi:hypothetical protein